MKWKNETNEQTNKKNQALQLMSPEELWQIFEDS